MSLYIIGTLQLMIAMILSAALPSMSTECLIFALWGAANMIYDKEKQ